MNLLMRVYRYFKAIQLIKKRKQLEVGSDFRFPISDFISIPGFFERRDQSGPMFHRRMSRWVPGDFPDLPSVSEDPRRTVRSSP